MSNNAPPIPLLLTRPDAAARRFVDSLPQAITERVIPIFSPLIRIEPTDAEVSLGSRAAVIFTSGNGVSHAPNGKGRTAYCIGTTTCAAASDAGWHAVSCGADADALVAHLAQLKPKEQLVHLHGTHTRGNVAGRLTDAGLNVDSVAVYDQVAQPLTDAAQEALITHDRVLVPLFSPRTASLFAASARSTAAVHAIALSPAVAAVTEGMTLLRLDIAKRPNAESIRDALAAGVRNAASG